MSLPRLYRDATPVEGAPITAKCSTCGGTFGVFYDDYGSRTTEDHWVVALSSWCEVCHQKWKSIELTRETDGAECTCKQCRPDMWTHLVGPTK